jgi:hypothetical protein
LPGRPARRGQDLAWQGQSRAQPDGTSCA